MTDVKKRGADYVPKALVGDEKVKLEDVLGKDIEVVDFVKLIGEDEKAYLSILAKREGKDKTISFNCGGQVVMKKLFAVKDNTSFPFWITIFKGKDVRYYDIK